VRVAPTVFRDPEALGRVLAAEIADEIAGAAHDGRRYVLGCPGGRSAHSTYCSLADEVAARGLDLGHVVIAMMDEYVDRDRLTDNYRRIDAELLHSCVRFGRHEIVQRLDGAAGPGRGIGAGNFLVPDPADPAAYDEQIAELGGIDLFLLASGSGDGHIAFNPTGTPPDAGTHVVALTEQTRRDNLATFPSFRGLAEVPHYGVTVGIGTIRDHSKRVVMVAHGTDKAKAVSRLTGADHYEPDWPATVFTDCVQPRLYVDRAALKAAEALTMSA
jgi:glucosamine-6-phosphate deaminase